MSGGIGVRTRKLLWMRSGGVCAHPDCVEELEEPLDGTDVTTITSIECHIVAQEDSAKVARSVSSLTDDERTEFAVLIEDRHGLANLVVMCTKHSRLIDDPARNIRVAEVVHMKATHEAAMKSGAKPVDPNWLRLAAIVDEWGDRIDLDDWSNWFGGLYADGHPRIDRDDLDRLHATRRWMFARVWPDDGSVLEKAFENFRFVAQDLEVCLERFPHEHLAKRGIVTPSRFYNDDKWIRRLDGNFPRLDELHLWWVQLIEDLALELTRAGNLVCEAVRQTIDARYRLDTGLLTLESGPDMDGTTRLHRPRYKRADGWTPYRGLASFVLDRATREEQRGSGDFPAELRPGAFGS